MQPTTEMKLRLEPLAFWAASAGAGLIGLLYWCLAVFRSDSEPMIITIMYRFGDTDYLPLIYSLARGHYSELMDPATYGTGLMPFPVVAILPYALGVAAFGDAGFVIADVAISVGRFLLIFAILSSITERKALAAGIALAIIPAMYGSEFYHSGFPGIAEGWNFRYPRPYVTQLFLLAVTLTSIHLFRQLRKRNLKIVLAFGHGFVIGIATQGDIHAAIGFALATALIFVGFIISDGSWKLVLTTGTWVTLGCLFGIIPWVVQSLYANADLLARWGAYEHARTRFLLFVSLGSMLKTLLIALAPSIRSLIPGAFNGDSATERDLGLVLVAIIAGALLAPLAAVALTGEAIQAYHFANRVSQAVTLGLFLTIAVMFTSVRLMVWLVAAATIAMAAIGALPMYREARAASAMATQQRVWAGEHWGDSFIAVQNYRRDLAALLRELDGDKYRAARILGTFDQQLAMLWTTRPRHTLFIPDTFLSLVGDDVIERRAAALSRLVGMSEDEFLRKANQPYFQLRFLTLAKWQATVSYLAAPPEDYNAAQLRNVVRTGPLDNWHTEMPQSAQNWLRSIYRTPQPVGEDPDLVILTDEASYSSLPGPTEGFALVYRNDSFRLFARK
jgi:hypothetical protein